MTSLFSCARPRLPLLAALVVAGLGATQLVHVATVAASATSEGKVQICHRTHSVKNPYRLINVSTSAVGTNGNSGTGSGHRDHVGPLWSADMVQGDTWGDVIPDDPTTTKVDGVNWDGTYPVSCTALTAQQYYDVEREAGQPRDAVLLELSEMGAEEDAGVAFTEITYGGTDPALQQADGVSPSPEPSASPSASPSPSPSASASPSASPTPTPAPSEPASPSPSPGSSESPSPTTAPKPTTTSPEPRPVAPQPQPEPEPEPAAPEPTQAPTEPVLAVPMPSSPAPAPSSPAPAPRPPVPATPAPAPTTTAPPTAAPAPPPVPPASAPVDPPEQELDGLVWLDLDRDGRQDPGEPGLPEMSVSLAWTAVETEEPDALLRPAAMTTPAVSPVPEAERHRTGRTSTTGALRLPSVPAGTYAVSVRVPSMLFVTDDSDGERDASARVVVPKGGSGRFWVGLVGDAGVTATVRDAAGRSADGPAVLRWFGPDGARLTSDDVLVPTRVVSGALDVGGLPAGSWEVSLGDGDGDGDAAAPVALALVPTQTATLLLHVPPVDADGSGSLSAVPAVAAPAPAAPRPTPVVSARALPRTGGGVTAPGSSALGLLLLGGLLLRLGRPRRTA